MQDMYVYLHPRKSFEGILSTIPNENFSLVQTIENLIHIVNALYFCDDEMDTEQIRPSDYLLWNRSRIK
jgi:hypothetical protein